MLQNFDLIPLLHNFFFFGLVSRINARSENFEADLTLDINSEIYPLSVSEKFTLLLSSSLAVDGSTEDKKDAWRETNKRSLADEYDYVMYGKIYKYDELDGQKV